MLRLDKDTNKAFWVLKSNSDGSKVCCFYEDRIIAEKYLNVPGRLIVQPDKMYIKHYLIEVHDNPHPLYFSMRMYNSRDWKVEIPRNIYIFERFDKDLLEIRLSFLLFIWTSLNYYFKYKDTLPYLDYLEQERVKLINNQ